VQTPALGIAQIPQADYYRRQWGIEGVIVLDVYPDTDPQRLGMRGVSRSQRGHIQLGDVIVEIDGQVVRNEDDYADVLERHRAGDTVKVKTVRDNQLLDYDIRLLAPSSR
jgi:S1-C subfamily serine protease